MSREVRWYVDRLQAMSPAELVYRGYRVARYPFDQLRMRTDRYARPSPAMRVHIDRWQGPEPFYFARELHAAKVPPDLFAEAEEVCAGKRRVLGLGWIDIPDDDWHHEPLARASWPRVDAARVVSAAPACFDPRLTWELGRGHEWVVLARVYVATRERRFLDRLVSELASWRRSNPIGVGIHWVSSMEAAIRIHSLTWCAGFLRGTADVLPDLAEMIYQHAVVVADHRSYFSSANNHLIVELSALIVASLAVGGDLVRMLAPALARLVAELDRQVLPDGVDAEMATHYHVFVLEALVLVAHLLRAHAIPCPPLDTVIRRMAEYASALRCDDGSLLQQGDSDDGCILGLWRTRHADQVLAAAHALDMRACRRSADAPSMPGGARDGLEGAFWLTGGAAGPPTARPASRPAARSQQFAASGQVIVRSRRLHAAFDAGPFGFGRLAAHAHCDALAIALAVDGRRLLVDRGTYRYNGAPQERECYRATAAHNTAQIGTLEQATPAGPFLWSRRPAVSLLRCELTDGGDIVQGRHDGFPGWWHRRTLVRREDLLVIADEFRGAAGAERVVSRYHLAPGLAIAAESTTRYRIDDGTMPIAWLVSNARDARVTVTPHSDEYARRTEAPTLELIATSDDPLIVAIAPADVPPEPSLAALARFATARGVQLAMRELAIAK